MNNQRIKVKNSRISVEIGASAIEHPWSIELKDKILGHPSNWSLNFCDNLLASLVFINLGLKDCLDL